MTVDNSSAQEHFEAMFREHYDRVLAYALARAQADLAKDVVAKTFLVAWRRRDAVPHPALPWLVGVARKMLAEERRTRRRRDGLEDRVGFFLRSGSAEDADPAETVADRATTLAALAELPPKDREVLQLVAWDGLSAQEAAASLGCSPGAFGVRLLRARRRYEAALARHDHADLPTVRHPVSMRSRRTMS